MARTEEDPSPHATERALLRQRGRSPVARCTLRVDIISRASTTASTSFTSSTPPAFGSTSQLSPTTDTRSTPSRATIPRPELPRAQDGGSSRRAWPRARLAPRLCLWAARDVACRLGRVPGWHLPLSRHRPRSTAGAWLTRRRFDAQPRCNSSMARCWLPRMAHQPTRDGRSSTCA